MENILWTIIVVVFFGSLITLVIRLNNRNVDEFGAGAAVRRARGQYREYRKEYVSIWNQVMGEVRRGRRPQEIQRIVREITNLKSKVEEAVAWITQPIPDIRMKLSRVEKELAQWQEAATSFGSVAGDSMAEDQRMAAIAGIKYATRQRSMGAYKDLIVKLVELRDEFEKMLTELTDLETTASDEAVVLVDIHEATAAARDGLDRWEDLANVSIRDPLGGMRQEVFDDADAAVRKAGRLAQQIRANSSVPQSTKPVVESVDDRILKRAAQLRAEQKTAPAAAA